MASSTPPAAARYVAENPATGRPLATIADCDATDVDRAVAAARRAVDARVWSDLHPAERKRTLIRFADLIDAHRDELALTESLDAGKPLSDTRSLDIPETAACIRWHAEAIDKLYDQVAPTGPGAVAMVVREPAGVVGAVVPWNYPAQMAAWKLGPALATGNSVVIKPAQQTSLSLLRMAELAAEAGLPEGVLNVVTGPGDVVGRGHRPPSRHRLSSPSRARPRSGARSSTTPPTRTSSGSCSSSAARARRSSWRDAADLDRVADQVANAIFWNMGENCSAGSRLIVHRDVKDALLERLVAATASWIVGDPLDEATRIGPMITDGHLQRVLGYIQAGADEGARIAVGGRRVLEETGGHFVAPTIFDGARNDMRIAQEEIFGPVLTVIEFDDGGRGDRPGQRHAVRPRGLDLHGERARRPPHGPRHQGRDDRHQRLQRGRHEHAVRRVQAVGLRGPRQVDPRPRPVHRAQDHLARHGRGLTRSSLSRPRFGATGRTLGDRGPFVAADPLGERHEDAEPNGREPVHELEELRPADDERPGRARRPSSSRCGAGRR